MASASEPQPPLPPRRILHLSPSFFPALAYGGPVTALYELVLAQQAAGLSPRVLTSDAAGGRSRLPGYGGQWTHRHRVPTYYGRTLVGEDLAPDLLGELPRELAQAELVHITGLFSATSIAGLLATLLARRPCVLTPRGSLLPWALRQNSERKRQLLRLLGPLLRRVAGWQAEAEDEAQAMRELQQRGLIGPQAVIAVIPNGITIPDAALLSARPGVAPDGGSIVVLGRVHPVKNLELAIESLALLRAQRPAARLEVVGPEREGSDYGDKLRALAAARGLADAVRFHGSLVGEAKQQLLEQAALLWLPSHMESFGIVVLDALAVGTPVVAATTTPWQRLESSGAGRWVAPTPLAFVAASAGLLAAQATASGRALLGRRCVAAIPPEFLWPAIERAMHALYRQAGRW